MPPGIRAANLAGGSRSLVTSKPIRQLPKRDASGGRAIEALPIPAGFQPRERLRHSHDRFQLPREILFRTIEAVWDFRICLLR